jgi:release factor glutamine methyltransferase
MTIQDARKKIIEEISNLYEGSESSNIAQLALEHVTQLPKLDWIKKQELLNHTQQKSIEAIIERLKKHEPIQYIISACWFAGMKFYVDKNVLIPRPETEELVDWLVKDCKSEARHFKILDIGTGSGCIAITIKKKFPGVEMWACDVSDSALTVARMNADRFETAIDFVALDFLNAEERKQLPNIDFIIANPPYVPLKDKNPMKKNVVDYEPHLALFVSDEDPLVFYKEIADFGKKHVHPGGRIYLEIHEELGERVKNLFLETNYSEVEIKTDMQGKDRMVKIVRSTS